MRRATESFSACSATETVELGFTQQKVDVLRHDHIGVDVEVVLPSRRFERREEGIARLGRTEMWKAPVAGKRDEVVVAKPITTLQPLGHASQLSILQTHISKQPRCGAPCTRSDVGHQPYLPVALSLMAFFHVYNVCATIQTTYECAALVQLQT